MAWSVLQSTSVAANGTGALSQAVAYTSNVSSGTKLIAVVSVSAAITSGGFTGIQDGSGNQMTRVAFIEASSGGSECLVVYAMDTPAGDVGTKPTLTASWTTTTADASMLIMEVSGLLVGNTSAMWDGTPATTEVLATASTSQPSYSSTLANEFLLVAIGDNGGPQAYTAPGGYSTSASNVSNNSFADAGVAWKNSTGGAESGTWTFTGTLTGTAFVVVAFNLASAAAPANAAQPGRTWLRHFKHRQLLPPPPTPAAAAQAAAPAPLQQPVKARRPLPLRGTAHGSAGVYDQLGPALTPWPGPIRGRLRQRVGGWAHGLAGIYDQLGPPPRALSGPVHAPFPPRRNGGTGHGLKGAYGGVGPPLRPLSGPVRAQPGVHRRAGWTAGLSGVYDGLGPPLTPLRQPVKARLPLRRGGQAHGLAGTFASVVITSGPPLLPLSSPVGNRRRPPMPGRAMAMGPLVVVTIAPTSGPAFEPLSQPAGARVSYWRQGHIQSSPGTFANIGTPLSEWNTAVRAKALPARGGRAMTMVPLIGTSAPITFGAPLTPLPGPVKARLPLRRAGWAHGSQGSFTSVVLTSGPPLTPLHSPVHSPWRLPPRGHVQGSRGTFNGVGPVVYPLHSPVQSRLRLRGIGRAYRSPGVFEQTGPALTPWHKPITSPRLAPPRGHAYSTPAHVAAIVFGPPLTPWHGPIAGRMRLRRGGHIFTCFAPPPAAGTFVPLQGTVALTTALADQVAITNTLAGRAAIVTTLAGQVVIVTTIAGKVAVINTLTGSVSIVNDL